MDGPLVASMGERASEVFSVGVEEREEVRRMTTWEKSSQIEALVAARVAVEWRVAVGRITDKRGRGQRLDSALAPWIWRWHHERGLGLLHGQGGGALGGDDLSASSRADDVCKEGKMQTSNAEDVFKALDEIEFPELVEPLRTALEEAKRQPGAKQRKLDKEPMLQSKMIEQTKPTRTTINCSNLVICRILCCRNF